MISAIEFAPRKYPTRFDWHIDLDDIGDINNIVLPKEDCQSDQSWHARQDVGVAFHNGDCSRVY
jgi:hypothetical protein